MALFLCYKESTSPVYKNISYKILSIFDFYVIIIIKDSMFCEKIFAKLLLKNKKYSKINNNNSK